MERAPPRTRPPRRSDAEEHQLQARENAAAGEEPPKVQRGAHARGEVEASRVPRVAAALRERRLRRVRSAGPYARQLTLRPRRGGYPRAVPEYPPRGGEQTVVEPPPRHRGDGGDGGDAGEPARDGARDGARGDPRGDPRGFLGAFASPVREGPYPRGGFTAARVWVPRRVSSATGTVTRTRAWTPPASPWASRLSSPCDAPRAPSSSPRSPSSSPPSRARLWPCQPQP